MKILCITCLMLTCLLIGGCMSQSALDRQVLRDRETSARADPIVTRNTLADSHAQNEDPATAPATVKMDLSAALQLATRFSHAIQDRREFLYLSGLDQLKAQRQFEPQLAGTLSYVLSRASQNGSGREADADLTATQVLPTGAKLVAETQGSALSGGSASAAGGENYNSSANLTLTQPLLAGAGYEASHEPLTQAERDLLYAVRTFAYDRQSFSIKIMQLYYDILVQQAVLENTRRNTEQATYLRRRSEAMFKVRQAPAVDVMRSQQQELAALNRLTRVEADFDIGVRRFLIELGVPVETKTEITGLIPELKPIPLDMDRCIRLALERRLDLKTARDKVADMSRKVRISQNGTLPQLDAFGSANWTGASTNSWDNEDATDEVQTGLTLTIPFDKRSDRDALRRSRIALAAARRAAAEKSDTIKVEITEGFRRLKALEQSAQIENKNRELAAKRAAYTTVRFKNGDLSNRDVVEAQDELLQASNAYVQALVAYETQRIRLLRDVGLLDVKSDGTIIEQSP